MALQSGAQIIIQAERSNNQFDCFAFSNIAISNPAFIAIANAATPQSRALARELLSALLKEISAIAPKLTSVLPPCGGVISDPSHCHANSDPDCQKLLVLVGDDKTPLPRTPFQRGWLSISPNHRVLPVFRQAVRRSVGKLIPKKLAYVNVEFWTKSVTEAIPAILALSGITVENPRIFISYRQRDTPALAMQLFDALSHQNFDTFLDHFRIPPGVNFQARLTQELGDKAMMLLIESEHTLDSEWTTYEINVAKTCGLGIFAVHVPKGVFVEGIDTAIRRELRPRDFKGSSFTPVAELKSNVLDSIVELVKREHDRALVRRRRILLASLEGALLDEGVELSSLASKGTLRVKSHTGAEYVVWLTPRPPELPDFHDLHGQTVPPNRGVVIGLSRLMEPRRFEQTGWLAGLCQIRLVDEGHLKQAAAKMANGLL